MFRQKISHHQLPWGPDSTLEGGWFWTHLDRRAEVWLSWEQSCPLNTWLLFALVTFHKFIALGRGKQVEYICLAQQIQPMLLKIQHCSRQRAHQNLCGWTGRLSMGWGISCDLPYDIWPCFFLWASFSPHHHLLQSCTIHEEVGSALLSWWCGLNKPRRFCQNFKTHFLLRMK